MSPTLKAFLAAFALLAATAIVAVIAMFVLAVTAGPSVAAGERAAVHAAIAYTLIAIAAVGAYWPINRGLTTMPRVLATALFGVLECLLLGALFVLTLVMLNR
jgi:hypothetical protein